MKRLIHFTSFILFITVIWPADLLAVNNEKPGAISDKSDSLLPVCDLSVDTLTSNATWGIHCDSTNPYANDIEYFRIFLDGNLVDITTDTFYKFKYLLYSEIYSIGVKVQYTYGLSELTEYQFQSGFLLSPVNPQVEMLNCNHAYIHWEHPRYGLLLPENTKETLIYGFDVDNKELYTVDASNCETNPGFSFDAKLICGDFSGLPLSREYLYAINFIGYENQRLTRIHIETGQFLDIGRIETPLPIDEGKWTAMACNKYIKNDMYACYSDGESSHLFYLDIPDNTQYTYIGEIQDVKNIACLAYNESSQKLFAVDIYSDKTYIINESTGFPTEIGDIGFDAEENVSAAYDHNTKQIYISTYNNDNQKVELRRLNQEDGSAEFLCDLDRESTILGFPRFVWPWMPPVYFYYLYCNNELADSSVTFPCEEEFNFTGFNHPDYYTFGVSANYNLEFFGYPPGEIGESVIIYTDSIFCGCYHVLPFSEDWNSSSFELNQWNVECTDNWQIIPGEGNPSPGAAFTGDSIVFDYSCNLKTFWLSADNLTDENIWIEFDVKLDDKNANGEESLKVCFDDYDSLVMLKEFHNVGSFDWKNQKIDITSLARDKYFRINFNANGTNSSNINAWYLDNINIYTVCPRPFNINATGQPTQGFIKISWSAPETITDTDKDFLYYQIFRSYENTEFEKIESFCTDTVFIDNTYIQGEYCYFVVSIFDQCTGISDTACVEYTVIKELSEENPIRIHPIPAKDKLHINSETEIQTLKLFNLSGKVMAIMENLKEGLHQMDVSDLENGVYFVWVETDDKKYTYKVLVNN